MRFKVKINQAAAKALLVYSALGLCNYAMAAGGLNVGTTEANSWKTWLYGILGVICLIYLVWLCIQAMWEKKQWSDVGWGLVHVAACGGIVAAGTYAWSLWGSGT